MKVKFFFCLNGFNFWVPFVDGRSVFFIFSGLLSYNMHYCIHRDLSLVQRWYIAVYSSSSCSLLVRMVVFFLFLSHTHTKVWPRVTPSPQHTSCIPEPRPWYTTSLYNLAPHTAIVAKYLCMLLFILLGYYYFLSFIIVILLIFTTTFRWYMHR